ncbi:hypothetical protein PVAP13_7NG074968 [Panicum virgatum]|uniref:Uncharacterized protein n=1 Tax=Panicum virgatum TaxID=38727 RepID=A0A8T0PS59_PANVG|nr:hypothetical protein PVAP13_7NG074968 [Panicum virgatum]
MKMKLRDLQRATVLSMEKTSERLVMRLVKWASTLFMVMRLGMMMTHLMTTMSTYCSPDWRIVVSTPTHHSSLEATSSPRHPSLPSSLQQARVSDTYPSQVPRSHLVAQAPVSSKQPTTGQGPATRTKCEDPNIHLGCAASSNAGSCATH